MAGEESAGASILVVDDEAPICRIVTRTLGRNGFVAQSASTAADLEHTLRHSSFDVILLDRSMDGPEGESLLPLVKELAPNSKVLFFTGEYVEPEEVAQVDGIVQKPINGKALAETLRGLL